MATHSEIFSDFQLLVAHVWHYLRLPEPTAMQLDIADWMVNGPERSGVMAHRGAAKTYLAIPYGLWRLARNPEEKVVVISKSTGFAGQSAAFAHQLLHGMDIFAHMRPRKGQANSKLSFDVATARAAKDPSFRCAGITGQITGLRGSIIIPDDIETPQNSSTQHQRDTLAEIVKEFDSMLSVNTSGAKILFLGTPHCEESLYNELGHRGYQFRVWPAEFPSVELQEVYGERLAPSIAKVCKERPEKIGEPTNPRMFPADELLKRRLAMGPSTYNLQFLLNTALSDDEKRPLKVHDLIITDVDQDVAPSKILHRNDPEYVDQALVEFNCAPHGDRFYRGQVPKAVEYLPYQDSVMSIDPSGRGKDEVGYAVIKYLNGTLYCSAAGGLTGGYGPETLKALAQIAKQNKVNNVLIEDNFGDGMFTQLFTPVLHAIHRCSIEEIKHHGQKELRILDSLEPVLASHRLVMDRGVIIKDFKSTLNKPDEVSARGYRLVHQMTRLERERGCLDHDDRIEALAMAVGYFKDNLDLDIDQAIEARRRELLMAEIEEMQNDSGNLLGGPSWLSSSRL